MECSFHTAVHINPICGRRYRWRITYRYSDAAMISCGCSRRRTNTRRARLCDAFGLRGSVWFAVAVHGLWPWTILYQNIRSSPSTLFLNILPCFCAMCISEAVCASTVWYDTLCWAPLCVSKRSQRQPDSIAVAGLSAWGRGLIVVIMGSETSGELRQVREEHVSCLCSFAMALPYMVNGTQKVVQQNLMEIENALLFVGKLKRNNCNNGQSRDESDLPAAVLLLFVVVAVQQVELLEARPETGAVVSNVLWYCASCSRCLCSCSPFISVS